MKLVCWFVLLIGLQSFNRTPFVPPKTNRKTGENTIKPFINAEMRSNVSFGVSKNIGEFLPYTTNWIVCISPSSSSPCPMNSYDYIREHALKTFSITAHTVLQIDI